MSSLRFRQPTKPDADLVVEALPSQSVFTLAQANAVLVQTACVGKRTCGLCRVKVLQGEALLSPYTDEETKHLGNVYHITKVRLACCTYVAHEGEVTLEPLPARPRKRS